MKKVISYVLIFVLGFVACAAALKYTNGDINPTLPILPSGTRAGLASVQDGKNSIADAAAKVEESVVNIDTIGKPANSGFSDYFDFFPQQENIPKGRASGVIIREDGYILTNNHVVADASRISVSLLNGKVYQAKIVGRDPKADLAVIKIDPKGTRLKPAELADTKKLRVGDWVVAVGNALGLGSTITVGVVSATNRGDAGTALEHAIQTDAAINRGNSGGALADINGRVIGINTAIVSTTPEGGNIGIGFAIPSEIAQKIADQLVKNGKVVYPWIGIMYTYLDDDMRKELRGQTGVPPVNGALIREVVPGSPADRAGLMPLDVIVEVNDKKVTSNKVISDAVKKVKVGGILDLTVWHARTQKNSRLALRTGEMPNNQ